MRSAARRVPRKIGQDDDLGNDDASILDPAQDRLEPVVKRPVNLHRPSSKPKKSSNLRTAFASLELPQDDQRDSRLSSKITIAQPTGQHSAQLKAATSDWPRYGAGLFDDRPSYDSNHLSELKNATPTTPRPMEDGQSISNGALSPQSLDISSKFGDAALALSIASEDPNSRIPSQAAIREKKERRRRLAKEQDYISLNHSHSDDVSNLSNDDPDNEHDQSHSLIIPAEEANIPSKYGETRLVHEDEDMAEGFDEFVEDQGKVALGRKSAKEQERQRRKDIEDQIRSAQHGYGYVARQDSSEDSDAEGDEEAKRNATYDAAQTRAGTYGLSSSTKETDKEDRLKKRLEIPKTRAVPEFQAVVAKFSNMVSAKEHDIAENRKRFARLEQEREEITKDEVRVQKLLGEAGERYEKLRAETATEPIEPISAADERGLESMASMIASTGSKTPQTEEDDQVEGA